MNDKITVLHKCMKVRNFTAVHDLLSRSILNYTLVAHHMEKFEK
jgi:hypothetical protein